MLPFLSLPRGRANEHLAFFNYERLYWDARYSEGHRSHEIDVQSIMCDVSWESSEAGGITVNRHALRTSDKAAGALRWLAEKVKLNRKNFVCGQQYKEFMALNYRVADVEPYPPGFELKWIVRAINEGEPTGQWAKHSFPVTTNVLFRERPEFDLEWEGNGVSVVDSMGEAESKDFNDGMTWHSNAIAPDRIVVCPIVFWKYPQEFARHRNRLRSRLELNTAIPGQEEDADYTGTFCNLRFGIVPLWTKAPADTQAPVTCGLACEFPLNWTHLCCVRFEPYAGSRGAEIWNPAHPVIRQLNREAWQWANKVFRANRNPLPYRDELLVNAARAASWILHCIIESSYEIWGALAETNPEFLPAIWSLIFGPKIETNSFPPICQWVQGRSEVKLRALTPNGWVAHRDWSKAAEEFKKYLPDPGLEWRLLPKPRAASVDTA